MNTKDLKEKYIKDFIPPKEYTQEEMDKLWQNFKNQNWKLVTNTEIWINELRDKVYNQNVEAGWHSKPREIGTCLMLIVLEIAEAMEGDRKSLMDDHLPHRSMLEVELADAVIRIMDLSGREGLDLGGAIVEKLEYNRTRADHKLENRNKENGKKY